MSRLRGTSLPALSLVLAVLTGGSHAACADGLDRVALLAHNCTTCHGVSGGGSRKVPKIKGLDELDIVQSMNGFRSGEEKQTIMGRLAEGLSDEEVKAVAGYFSRLK